MLSLFYLDRSGFFLKKIKDFISNIVFTLLRTNHYEAEYILDAFYFDDGLLSCTGGR